MVLDAIVGVCRHRDWTLLAAHARSNHVHVVVAAESAPERMLNDFKAYASRALGAAKLDDPRQIRWARHGSTRWLLTAEEVEAAVRYVVHGQGAPMAVWALGGAGVATAP